MSKTDRRPQTADRSTLRSCFFLQPAARSLPPQEDSECFP